MYLELCLEVFQNISNVTFPKPGQKWGPMSSFSQIHTGFFQNRLPIDSGGPCADWVLAVASAWIEKPK